MTARESSGTPDDEFRIVLNYRREDTSGHAGRLYDALAARFGDDHVFMDIDKIDPGEDFERVIDRAIDASDVFLALIGRDWLTVTDARGRSRLDNAADFVRMEIESALSRDVRVIPVLLQGAEMPSPDDVPPSLRGLARRNAVELRDTSWRSDIERLAEALERIRGSHGDEEPELPPPPPPPPPPNGGEEARGRSRLPVVIAGAALLAAAAVVGLFVLLRSGESAGDGSERGGGGKGELTPAPGRIAFWRAGEGISYMRSDGSGVTQLPRASATDRDPDWSSNGTALAIARDNDIWIVAPDADEASPVIRRDALDGQPAWSPRNDALAFESKTDPDARYGIWLVAIDPDGRPIGRPTDLSRAAGRAGAVPDWSSDGALIAFQAERTVWVMRRDGSGVEPVASSEPPFDAFPAWAPAERLLAYVQTGGRCTIVVVDPDAPGARRTVLDREPECREPAWSPDGNQIAFADREGISLVDVESRETKLVHEGEGYRGLAWGREP